MDSYSEDSDEWKEAKNHRDTCLSNLNTYQSYLTEAITQKAEIYVQRENYLFINNNKDILRIQDQKKTISEFKEKCLYLIVLKENYNLASSSVDYNSLLYQINRASFYQGRATQMDVDYHEAELLIANNNRELVLSSYNNLFKYILRMVNISENQNTGIRFDIKALNRIQFETAYNSFQQNDIKKKQLESNILIVDGKIDILDDIYDEQSNILAIEKKKKEIALFELDNWLLDRTITFNNLYSDYESKYDDVNLQEKKAAAQQKKYTVVLNKFNLGLVSRIELEEARLKLRQSELDAWTAFYEYIKAYNRIELAILGLV
jgi:outer membrane protein TolC